MDGSKDDLSSRKDNLTISYLYCWLPLAVSGANPGMKKCSLRGGRLDMRKRARVQISRLTREEFVPDKMSHGKQECSQLEPADSKKDEMPCSNLLKNKLVT